MVGCVRRVVQHQVVRHGFGVGTHPRAIATRSTASGLGRRAQPEAIARISTMLVADQDLADPGIVRAFAGHETNVGRSTRPDDSIRWRLPRTGRILNTDTDDLPRTWALGL